MQKNMWIQKNPTRQVLEFHNKMKTAFKTKTSPLQILYLQNEEKETA